MKSQAPSGTFLSEHPFPAVGTVQGTLGPKLGGPAPPPVLRSAKQRRPVYTCLVPVAPKPRSRTFQKLRMRCRSRWA